MKLITPSILILILAVLVAPCTAQPAAETDNPTAETFEIDGHIYIIPEPWTGHRIKAPSPAAIKFSPISQTHTQDGAKVYIEKRTNKALQKMLDAAEEDGIYLLVESGFRSYNYQMRIFTKLMRTGREYDDIIRYVAPPGYSQHALGTAVDFYPSNWEFADLPAYLWLKENAGEFGFSETYTRTNELGFPWEAWHWNYNGEEQTAKDDTENKDQSIY